MLSLSNGDDSTSVVEEEKHSEKQNEVTLFEFDNSALPEQGIKVQSKYPVSEESVLDCKSEGSDFKSEENMKPTSSAFKNLDKKVDYKGRVRFGKHHDRGELSKYYHATILTLLNDIFITIAYLRMKNL